MAHAMRFEAAAACALTLLPTAAWAVDYLSAEQAQQAMFPDADRFEPRELLLDAAQMKSLADAGVRARSARWPVQVALRGMAVLGFVVVDNVVGKFELITYAVGLGADGAVRQVEVLSYRESHGHEIRLPAWRRQFVGKTAASPLQVGDDIANLSGATLSCQHVTEGVRRIVTVIDLARRSGRLG
jgi:Na+-translocating ferredoxin:NAD+ oxidoreductase RnfG subunit